jgi:hypothetical protein
VLIQRRWHRTSKAHITPEESSTRVVDVIAKAATVEKNGGIKVFSSGNQNWL